MDSSQNTYNADVTSVTERLDAWEKRVFASGQRGLSDIMRWEKRQTEKLSTSTMVLNHRKRKRAQMEQLWCVGCVGLVWYGMGGAYGRTGKIRPYG